MNHTAFNKSTVESIAVQAGKRVERRNQKGCFKRYKNQHTHDQSEGAAQSSRFTFTAFQPH
jgi:hypothetical protein